MAEKSIRGPAVSKAVENRIIAGFVEKVMSSVSRLECAHCGHTNGFDFYMVRKPVWKAAGLKRDQFCCLDCLSDRLGRELAIADFDPRALINRQVIFGYRMARAELKAAKGRTAGLSRVPGLPRLPTPARGRRSRKKPRAGK